LVELTCFHQYIGVTVTVTTNTLVEQCQQHQYIGGNISSKMKIKDNISKDKIMVLQTHRYLKRRRAANS
jgi:hypothetical protein